MEREMKEEHRRDPVSYDGVLSWNEGKRKLHTDDYGILSYVAEERIRAYSLRTPMADGTLRWYIASELLKMRSYLICLDPRFTPDDILSRYGYPHPDDFLDQYGYEGQFGRESPFIPIPTWGKLLDHTEDVGLNKADVETLELGAPNRNILPCPTGTKWEDITITLVTNTFVKIQTPGGEGRFSYHELGMRDRRAGNRPTILWFLITLFAANQGFLASFQDEHRWISPDKIEQLRRSFSDTAKRLNKHLQQLFGIPESIYAEPYKKEKGYRTKIHFLDRRPHAMTEQLMDEDESLEGLSEIFEEAQDIPVRAPFK